LDYSNKKLSILAAIYSNKSKINEQNIETTTDTEGLIYPSTQSPPPLPSPFQVMAFKPKPHRPLKSKKVRVSSKT